MINNSAWMSFSKSAMSRAVGLRWRVMSSSGKLGMRIAQYRCLWHWNGWSLESVTQLEWTRRLVVCECRALGLRIFEYTSHLRAGIPRSLLKSDPRFRLSSPRRVI